VKDKKEKSNNYDWGRFVHGVYWIQKSLLKLVYVGKQGLINLLGDIRTSCKECVEYYYKKQLNGKQ